MAIVNYRFDGDLLSINIHTESGNYQIVAKTIVDPDGDRCVIYDGYSVSLNESAPNATDIDYYVNKIRRIVNLYEQNFDIKGILNNTVQEHVNRHGRIIDNDLMMIVSALARTLIAIEGKCNSKELILLALDIVLDNFIDSTFITVYNKTPYGIQPKLVRIRDYMNQS